MRGTEKGRKNEGLFELQTCVISFERWPREGGVPSTVPFSLARASDP